MPAPDNPAILKQQVMQLAQQQRFEDARELCRTVCEQAPGDSEAWFLLGAISGQLSDFAGAESACQRALELQPGHPGLHYNLGIALLRQNKTEQAIASFEQAIRINPQLAEAHHDLGNALKLLGQMEPAIEHYQQAIQLRAGFFLAHFNLGTLLQHQGRLDQATNCYRQAIQLQPNFAPASNALAVLYLNQRQFAPARTVLEAALARQPRDAGLHHKLGVACLELGNAAQALQHFEQALAIDPGHIDAAYGAARSQRSAGRLEAAIVHLETVLASRPDFAEAWAVLGGIRKDQGKVDQGLAAFRKALALDPARPDVHSSYLLNLNYTESLTPEEVCAEHRRWAEQHGRAPVTPEPLVNRRDPQRRLRIGFVSADFRTHSVAYFFEPLLLNRDRSQFSYSCYANLSAQRADAITARLRDNADHWCDISAMSDTDAARQIRADGIDILVDLAGHSAAGRPGLFALRPAPVQFSYLGYPNTTGLDAIDYRLTDGRADPPACPNESLYSETLLRLPHSFLCYQPPADAPAIEAPPVLTSGQITFGSFNNLAKVTPDVVIAWANLLHAIPGSQLIMKNSSFRDASTRAGYEELFAQQGIAAERLTLLAGVASVQQHLAMYNRVDIALDTFPYNGTTTTCEALWMGVPVITLAGNAHASRVGASLLGGLGLEQLIATSPARYQAIGCELAADTAVLQQLRQSMRERMRASPLCDAPTITRDIETLMRKAWQDWCDMRR